MSRSVEVGAVENGSTPGGSTQCASVIIDELIMLGVTEVVVAPGSRSAPLALAAWRADQDGRIRLHVRIDERTAGFLALGLGKLTGRPAAAITTSGTAPAHLHPAVLEAWHARSPLIMISADRPATMVNTGANQTADQVGLFGRHVVADARMASSANDPAGWRTSLRRLVVATRGDRTRRPGPVHLNVELEDPLTPPDLTTAIELPTGTSFSVQAAPAAEPVTLEPGLRTVVVAGDATPSTGSAAVRFAVEAGVPLLAEPSSNARTGEQAIGAYRLLLETPLAEEIQRVVVFGHPTLSRPVQRLLARTDLELIMVSASAEWIDPGHAVNRVVDGVTLSAGDDGWLARWRDADAALTRQIGDLTGGSAGVTGWQVAETVWRSAGPRTILVAGSSQPIRDLDLVPVTDQSPVVVANRGLGGIDGTLSTAVGVALSAQAGQSGRSQPVTVLVGDLTFLHDLNGLVIGPDEPRPDLRIVVVNDDGGSIFHTLEQGAEQYDAAFERVFGTPHHVDLGSLVTGLGHMHRLVDSIDALSRALSIPARGIDVVECRIDRSSRRMIDQQLQKLASR